MRKDDKPILTDDEIAKLKVAVELGMSNLQAIYDTGVAEELFDQWYLHHSGDDLVKRWRVMRTVPAMKMFHRPTNHKEAEAVLKRHPDTKIDYSDRTEHTGAGGKDLEAILVKFIDGKNDKHSG